jgi:hypothetical protein
MAYVAGDMRGWQELDFRCALFVNGAWWGRVWVRGCASQSLIHSCIHRKIGFVAKPQELRLILLAVQTL